MNFRDLVLMNDAFLAKQFWRLLENPTSLYGRTLKSKYFQSCDLLSSTLQQTSSPLWKGIWKAGMELKTWIVSEQNLEPRWLGESDGTVFVKSAYQVLKQIKDAKQEIQTGESLDNTNMKCF